MVLVSVFALKSKIFRFDFWIEVEKADYEAAD